MFVRREPALATEGRCSSGAAMTAMLSGAMSQSRVAEQVLLDRRQRQCSVLISCTIRVPEPLGARFVQNTHRSRESLHLTVVQDLNPSGRLAIETPQLQLGMILSRIGDVSVIGREHNVVMDALQARPLQLTFVDSLHKVMRVVTGNDLRAAFDFAMSARHAHNSSGGGASYATTAALVALDPSVARHHDQIRHQFDKRRDDARAVRRDLQNELRMTPGDAELTLWLSEVEEMCRELDTVTAEPLPVSVAREGYLQSPPPRPAGKPARSQLELEKVSETRMAKTTIAADKKVTNERKSKIRKELIEKDDLGSLVLNAGRRLDILRHFFAKHDHTRPDAAIMALWEANGGKCSDPLATTAVQEESLFFSDLLDRLKRDFGEDPLKYYQDEQRKRLRTTLLSRERLEKHSAAIQEAEDVYVKSAAEAKAIDDAAQRVRGIGETVAPQVDREPHTVTVKFWSDEKPMGLSLEYWRSVARPGHRYVRITGVAPDSLAEEIPEIEKGMTIEAINGVAPHDMRKADPKSRTLDTVYEALRQRPVLVIFGFRIAEQAEDQVSEDTRTIQAVVKGYVGDNEKSIAAKIRTLAADGTNGGLVPFDELDVNGDGQVSRLEYLQVLEKKKSQVVVETLRERERAKEQEERTVAARRQQEAREVRNAVHELRKAASGDNVGLMQKTLSDYEGYENQDVAMAWAALEVALMEANRRARRKAEEAEEMTQRALRREQETDERKRLAEQQSVSPVRARVAADMTEHKLASRAKQEDEQDATRALLAEAKLEGRRRAAIAIASDPILRQVPSPRMVLSSGPPSPPGGRPSASIRKEEVLNGSERWALSGSLAESQMHSVSHPQDGQRPVASRSRGPTRQTHQPPPLPTRTEVHGHESSLLAMRPSSLSHAHVPTDIGSLGHSAAGFRSGSPGRSGPNRPAVRRSPALIRATSNDDDDSTDDEDMPGITKSRQYRGGSRKVVQQGRNPFSQGAKPTPVVRDDTSDGESTPPPPPPPNMPPPPSARGPPPSLPNRDRRSQLSDDSHEYSTEAEMTRLNQRAFVSSRRRRSPARGSGGRRHDVDGARRNDSPVRDRHRSRGYEHRSLMERDAAVIVMPSSNSRHGPYGDRPRRDSGGTHNDYDSALSF